MLIQKNTLLYFPLHIPLLCFPLHIPLICLPIKMDLDINEPYYKMEHLGGRIQEFLQQRKERINLNRQRILYAGRVLVGSMILTSIGLPLPGGVITQTIANVSTNSASLNEIIHLRDVWDASLKNY